MLQISLSEEAQTDADSAIDWYVGEGAFIAAEDFINEIERALGLLKQFPALGEVGMHKARSFPPWFSLLPDLPTARRFRPRHRRCPS
jgi:plasmid stabilization system protein ParE